MPNHDVSHLRQTPDGSDCTRCGLCCTSPHDLPFFVEVLYEDIDRMPTGFVRRNVTKDTSVGCPTEYAIKVKMLNQPKGSPLEGRKVRVCRGFRGALGKKCDCTIYDTRPTVCREFQPRHESCMRIRLKFVQAIEAGKPQEALE